ncbi:hypothetical protein MGG_02698 [Pyricularia oryzae 70-15]|uniref:Uncharacterized protein n=1 Tax=Pyricularia oryzae (strain 70-15 / ATCC MYA-4617 / FGSC 8958) TaxID=242507 RepID=G4NJA8_PYRO7|nr:uncharacterized protein MGG_02698 [Pyricularia oryzae 70-15]EHA46324.1 hypothetical protein MGG_02698 [Pyricularia oryzae 70-15]KAI7923163.1 hypothetical protein M9X92_004537 [Pyricularia oryzae]KAI7926096.1 hypothetical protein M0657_003855 [Pyricularia oryzae]
MPPVQEDHRHHMSYVPALEGENNLDEWKRNVIRALTSRGLIHVLEGVQHDQESSQDEVECSSSSAPEVSVEICTVSSFDANDYFEVSRPLSFGTTSDTECYVCTNDHPSQSHTNSNVDAASDMSARQEKQRSMERSEAVLLMSQSLVGVHEWLVLHGFDASEENPARYFQAVQDVFTQLSTWTEDSTKEELMKIQPDPFKPIEAYQQRLSFLRNRYLRAGGFWSRDDREREVLWWAIEGIKAWSTTLHARLTRDMMEAPGSGQRLTWPRLMQQLAFIHECDRYDYILGPEATDGQSRIMIKKCYR